MISVSIHLYYENNDKIVFVGKVNDKNSVYYDTIDNIVSVYASDGKTFRLIAANNASVGIFIESGKEDLK